MLGVGLNSVKSAQPGFSTVQPNCALAPTDGPASQPVLAARVVFLHVGLAHQPHNSRLRARKSRERLPGGLGRQWMQAFSFSTRICPVVCGGPARIIPA
jgi:hypothetical protein